MKLSGDDNELQEQWRAKKDEMLRAWKDEMDDEEQLQQEQWQKERDGRTLERLLDIMDIEFGLDRPDSSASLLSYSSSFATKSSNGENEQNDQLDNDLRKQFDKEIKLSRRKQKRKEKQQNRAKRKAKRKEKDKQRRLMRKLQQIANGSSNISVRSNDALLNRLVAALTTSEVGVTPADRAKSLIKRMKRRSMINQIELKNMKKLVEQHKANKLQSSSPHSSSVRSFGSDSTSSSRYNRTSPRGTESSSSNKTLLVPSSRSVVTRRRRSGSPSTRHISNDDGGESEINEHQSASDAFIKKFGNDRDEEFDMSDDEPLTTSEEEESTIDGRNHDGEDEEILDAEYEAQQLQVLADTTLTTEEKQERKRQLKQQLKEKKQIIKEKRRAQRKERNQRRLAKRAKKQKLLSRMLAERLISRQDGVDNSDHRHHSFSSSLTAHSSASSFQSDFSDISSASSLSASSSDSEESIDTSDIDENYMPTKEEEKLLQQISSNQQHDAEHSPSPNQQSVLGSTIVTPAEFSVPLSDDFFLSDEDDVLEGRRQSLIQSKREWEARMHEVNQARLSMQNWIEKQKERVQGRQDLFNTLFVEKGGLQEIGEDEEELGEGEQKQGRIETAKRLRK